LLLRLDTIISQSLEALTSAASGDSLCTLKGVSVQAAKYHEGQTIAAKDFRRALVRYGSATGSPAALLKKVRQQWEAKNPPRPDAHAGESYRTGGIDMFESLEAVL
jgi:hypothetical protein